jgi:hypothetical protein
MVEHDQLNFLVKWSIQLRYSVLFGFHWRTNQYLHFRWVLNDQLNVEKIILWVCSIEDEGDLGGLPEVRQYDFRKLDFRQLTNVQYTFANIPIEDIVSRGPKSGNILSTIFFKGHSSMNPFHLSHWKTASLRHKRCYKYIANVVQYSRKAESDTFLSLDFVVYDWIWVDKFGIDQYRSINWICIFLK